MAKSTWYFLMFKLTDIVELTLLIMSKKRQIMLPFLRTHHFFVFVAVWIVVKFFPGMNLEFILKINNFQLLTINRWTCYVLHVCHFI
jgi:hypothetical protein